MAQLLADVARDGDPARGEAIFRRKDLTCLKCHAIAGAGGQVGPGLESIGASAQPDYLVDSLLQPSKQVKENYHAIVVATNDGQVFTGIKLRQTDTELVLRDAEDREVSIPLNSIEEQKPGRLAHAAPAWSTSLTRPELVDLVRFLSELGKVGPYRRRHPARLPALAGPRADAGGQRGPGPRRPRGRAAADDRRSSGGRPTRPWPGSCRSRNGPNPARSPDSPSVALARTQTPGHDPGQGEALVQLDRRAVASGSTAVASSRPGSSGDVSTLVLDLTPGLHTLAVAVPGDRREGIRCVLDDVPGSPARAQAVLGK